MKVLLLQDVYKLGRAGDVKKVADGYGRNYLIPQGLAALATPGALRQAEYIKKVAAEQRAILNKELGAVSDRLNGLELFFPVKAGETGRLYGSVTTTMIAEAIKKKTSVEIDRKQVDIQPIKLLGVHKAEIRLTMDLVPEIALIVHREGEPPESVMDKEIAAESIITEDFVELQAELEAMDIEAEEKEEVQDLVDSEEVMEPTSESESSSANPIADSPQENVSEED
jgi:large subunit ribosomal protein L9